LSDAADRPINTHVLSRKVGPCRREARSLMATFGEIVRWFVFTIQRGYGRLAARLLRRDVLLMGSERRFKALLEAAPDAMVIVDWHGHITLVNAQTERLFGYEREEIVGQNIADLLPDRERTQNRELITRYLREASSLPMGSGAELLARRKDGSEFPVEISLSPLETDEGVLVYGAVRDITDRKKADAQLRYLADHDGLTGLINRRNFEDRLAVELARAGRYEVEGALLLIDIDNLKDVNDTLGHAYGDEVLRSIATLFRKRLRETDTVARLGGDEFAVLLSHTPAEEAAQLARELVSVIRDQQVMVRGKKLRVTVSVGVATFGIGPSLGEDVMLAADVALYEAKEMGRDRIAVHAPHEGEVAKRQVRATWSQRIRQGLDEGLLIPYRQPIMTLATRTIEQYELLVRMLDGEGRAISPIAFLPTAERTGMVREIDRMMVGCAIELIATSPEPVTYDVNLSARSLSTPELPGQIRDMILARGIDPSLLVFEITETAAIANMEAAVGFGKTLRDLGCGLALDDFGAGFASFYNLKHMPLDWLKIDGDFITNLATSETDQLLVRHMTEIGDGLGMRTIAEFVEDEKTLELLAGYGVTCAQGFHIGRPEPVEIDVTAQALSPPRRNGRVASRS
jgi:diguanylate cyclase (GGDEF)-like protein/PAS domain S-box-containing protein